MGSERGRLIVVEGIDGSGKTTVVAGLAERLAHHGTPVQRVSPVTSGAVGLDHLRAGVKLAGDPGVGVVPGVDVFAVYLAYAFLGAVARDVLPALERGETVVADRWEWSFRANQAAFGLDLSALEPLFDTLPRPDRVIRLSCGVETALERCAARGPAGVLDRPDLLRIVDAELDRSLRGIGAEIDADRPVDAVLEDAWSALGIAR